MKGRIIWKLVLTAIVLAWAVSSMTPFADTKFEDYIEHRATKNQAEFSKVLDGAKKRVDPANYKKDPNKSSSLFTALSEYANANSIDLSQFFDVNVSDIKVLKKKNDVLVKELYRQSRAALKKGLDLKGGVSFTLEINKDELEDNSLARKGQLEDVLRVMDSRINGLGVAEPNIRIIGDNAVEVQMPDFNLKENPEAAEALSRPAKLEFRLAHRSIQPSSAKAPKREWPIGYELLTEERTNHRTGEVYEVPLYIKKRAEAMGDIIKHSGVHMDDTGRFSVGMDFTSEGSKKFYEITKKILEEDKKYAGSTNEYEQKQLLAIVLDGKLISAPRIISAISDRGSITGDFNQREAMELANALNNPLKVGLKRTSMNEVAPSMAADARNSSLVAAAIGAGLVFLFMVLYYRGMGVIAMITVVANIVFILGVLASFGATMTLPGIAALVLTVGMAVDANILIFERMREELLAGKSMWNALQAGYEKAFSTIVDANLTTLLTAVILWKLGTGPVKGFGVTLAVGILATLFCALIFGRALCEIAVSLGWFKNSFKWRLIGETNLNVMKYFKATFVASWIVILCGVAAVAYRGDKCVSIDFTGGETQTLSYNKDNRLSVGDITSISNSALGEVQASYQRDLATGNEILTVQTENGKGEAVLDALQKKYPNADLKSIDKTSIGASVSSDITENAVISLLLAFGGILLYVALRFEIGFGVGAVVALVHDILMSIGLYVILGMLGIGSGLFSAPMIAAVLMTVGYSINDKIVVFDRIREELPLNPTMSLYDVIRKSINKTFARTILTSITTFFAALALFVFGTGIIKDFSLIFLLGIITGTFSSIFIASPVFYAWHRGKRKNVESAQDAEIKHEWEE
ncbi:MAG: protein translocase subunit SecD [Opitutales bacterium]|nr:protein translocase subunit SecD [Opitutales bacterium]